MKVSIIELGTLTERSALINMLLRNDNQMYCCEEKTLTLGDCHQLYFEQLLHGFFEPYAIESMHAKFVREMSDPESSYERIVSTFSMKFLVVVLDYYCVDSWWDEIINFVVNNEKVYWTVFNELLVMSFVDNGHIEKFTKQVDWKKHYRPMPPFKPFEPRRPIARSFAEIIAAIGTYADRK